MSTAEQPPGRDEALLELIAAMSKELGAGARSPEVRLDSSLERDLGFDSLARMELLSRIEARFDCPFPEALLAEAETPRDLVRGLETSPPPGAAPAPQAGLSAGAGRLVPGHMETLTDALRWQADNHGDSTHIRLLDDQGQAMEIKFGGLLDRAARLAAGLADLGLTPGETVMLMLPTGEDYFAGFMGVLLAGGIPVPVYPPARAAQIEEHLRRQAKIGGNCRARVVITDPGAGRFAPLLTSLIPTLSHVTTADELIGELAGEPAAGATRTPLRYRAGAGDTAFIQYTSGSTGDPKGVVLTHANLLANIRAMGRVLEAGPDDVFVSWLPLYHDMGLIGAWLGSLVHGIPLVLMSPLTFLARPQRWLSAISDYQGTISGAPNFAYEACIRRIPDDVLDGLDLSSWRVAFNGAETVSPATMDAFCERFAPCGFRREAMMPVYGLAENSVGLAFPPLGRGPRIEAVDRDRLMSGGVASPAGEDEAGAVRLPSCGVPLPGHQIRIAGADGRELPDRHEGHVQFQGPSATSGYLRRPDRNAEMFKGARGDWLDSGDLGFMADGELFVTGRAKDMIVRAGRNIFPAELENAIGELEGVQRGNVAVFGAPDPDTETERLVVLAESRHRDEARRQAIKSEIVGLSSDLAGTPPDDIVLVPPRSVPKTSSGKIRRQAARTLYLKGDAGSAPGSVRMQLVRLALAALPGLARRWGARTGSMLYGIWAGLVLLAVAVPAWLLVAMVPSAGWGLAVARTGLRLIRALTAMRITVGGLENISPDGGFVIAANHSSYLDGPVLLSSLPGRLCFVAKGELASQLIAGTFLRRLGTAFVERFDRAQGAADAERLAAAIRRGRPLVYFPEGTLSRMPGLLPFRMGAFAAAVAADVPVLPVVIRGSRSALRDGAVLLRPHPIRVEVLPAQAPRPAGGGEAPSDWDAAVELRDRVRAEMLRHAGEPDLAHEMIYPPPPED
ncbi:MAG: AMP-binding protein [Rhodospirillales bacterium]|nr:AMP-binding protein [Rhodospirillales bacterium]